MRGHRPLPVFHGDRGLAIGPGLEPKTSRDIEGALDLPPGVDRWLYVMSIPDFAKPWFIVVNGG